MAQTHLISILWPFSSRFFKKRIGRFLNYIRNITYPARFQSLWIILTIISALHFTKSNFLFGLHEQTICCRLIVCFLAGLTIWLGICLTMRYILKLLFTYKGWMYESRAKGSKVSLMTRLWVMAVKILTIGSKPGLFSFQRSLPRLPLPSIDETLARYFNTVRPLLNDFEFKRVQKMATEFQQTIASKLQRYLVLKSWWSSNYVTDWWEEYVYLRGRNSLMINSNYYCLDVTSSIESNVQSARAAVIVHLMLRFRRLLDREELEPIMGQKLVPLCSWQYERLFNTVREPGIKTDRLKHYSESDHIVVIHKGCYFKVIIHKGRLLKPIEIQFQLEEILKSKSKPIPGEERLASFTSWERTKWAIARQTIFNNGINAESLHIIESAAFILCLDDEAYETSNTKTCNGLDHLARSMFHGNGHNRWFDKSFNLCIGTNGRIGFNSEHSWADAIIMGHLWEVVLKDEVVEKPYDKYGNCKGKLELQPPLPQRLSWDLNNDDCLSKINEAYVEAQKSINDLQLCVYVHDRYGKGFMKKCLVSPDAFVQMALQLAYYRDTGRLTLTYEASMTRLFLQGRTETVRSVSMESVAWVKAMDDNKFTNKHRISLLRKACERHQNSYRDAMCGKGVDRHLFCLYVVSKYLGLESPFLKTALSEPWRLSTSQSPHGQTGRVDHRNSGGGGFGPVADDGYGVSYMITGENELNFHITSKASCRTTDAKMFSKQIERAMADIQNLFQ